jgi:sodium/proline symporter
MYTRAVSTYYIVLVLYFLILLGIGAVASRRVVDLADFLVGGKKLGYWVVAFSARATGESAWLLLGLTGMGAAAGLSAFWVVLGEVLGVAVGWFVLAPPFKAQSDAAGSITVPDYLVSVFEAKGSSGRHTTALRALAAGALALFVTIYVSAQIDATGKAFESFLSWNYFAGALVGFAIVVVYTFAGGFVAVAWSDLFQGLIMLVGLVALPLTAIFVVTDLSTVWVYLEGVDPALTSIWGSEGFGLEGILVVISFLAIGLGFLGSPQVFVRFMSLRRSEDLRQGRWVAVIYTILTDSAAVMAGIFGRYLLVGDGSFEQILGASGEEVLPEMAAALFPPVVVGIYVAAVLAAIMSTIDSLLVVASSAVTRDFYQQIFHPDLGSRRLTRLSRTTTLILAAVALFIAMTVSLVSPDRTIFWYVIFGWSGIAATFCPTIILSLFYRRFTVRAAIAAMSTGLISVPLFQFLFPNLPVAGPYFALMGEMAPAFALSLIVGLVVSAYRRSESGIRSPRPEDRSGD